MREIKFRGKIGWSGKWVYGSLVLRKCDGIQQYYIYDSRWDETEISEYCNSNDCMDPKRLKDLFIPVIPGTVGQFVGFPDKNKVEVYKGDIVTVSMSFKGGVLPHRGEIVYDKTFGAFATKNQSGTTLLHNHCLYTLEVIGNMTDNKELLS